MLRLTTTHDQEVRQADLPNEPTELGAATECGIHLPFPGVSRRHARVEPVPGGVRVVDLGSKNGLRQKGRRLHEVTLQPGDSVHLGRARLTLEQIETSDAVLVGSPRPAARPKVLSKGDTDTVASGGADSTPGEALRLLREIETSGVELGSADGNELLARATRVMGALSLFVFTPSHRGAALRQVFGAAPSTEHLHAALELATRAHDEEVVSVRIADEASLLICRLGTATEAPILGAVLSSPGSQLKQWRRDLFGYVAHRLRPIAARKAPAVRTPVNASLVLPEGFVRGRAPSTLRLLDQLLAAARSDLDVVILGETGTGKEYVARIIHDSGPTARGPFVAINCAAIPSELLEAELFGVKARIATGVDPRPGLLTRAAGGCVFLDEIGDMPQALQAKLLRALQEREVMPIGAHQPEPIHVRVLSSTNQDLTALVRAGRFRADLYFRLRGLEFALPPLRERVEDVALLALAFTERAANSHGKGIAGISRRALSILEAHDWPGNVRELRSEIERAVLLCPDGGTLSSKSFESLRPAAKPPSGPLTIANHRPDKVDDTPPAGSTLSARVDEIESRAILEALALTRGNRTAAALRLGITRNGLALKMKRLGISAPG
jgi:DNA-binding NtrC family response regulator